MYVLFGILFLLSLLALVIGLIRPFKNGKTGKRYKRRGIGVGLGSLVLIFIIIATITAPPKKPVDVSNTANIKKVSTPVKQQLKPKTTTTTTVATVTPKTTTATTTPVTTTTPTPNLPILTGYGATQTEWNKTHAEDSQFSSGSAYNPEPSVTGGCNGVEYCGFTNSTNYQMGFPNHESLATVQAVVMQEFPSDATIVWQQENTSGSPDVCYQMEVHSASVNTVLQDGGYALVELQTVSSSNTSGNIEYVSSNVNTVLINATENTTASNASGC